MKRRTLILAGVSCLIFTFRFSSLEAGEGKQERFAVIEIQDEGGMVSHEIVSMKDANYRVQQRVNQSNEMIAIWKKLSKSDQKKVGKPGRAKVKIRKANVKGMDAANKEVEKYLAKVPRKRRAKEGESLVSRLKERAASAREAEEERIRKEGNYAVVEVKNEESKYSYEVVRADQINYFNQRKHEGWQEAYKEWKNLSKKERKTTPKPAQPRVKVRKGKVKGIEAAEKIAKQYMSKVPKNLRADSGLE